MAAFRERETVTALRLLVGAAAALAQASAAAVVVWEPLYEPGCGGAIVSVEENPHDPQHIVSGGDMLGTAASFDGGEHWLPGLGLSTYEMATPTFHPTRKDEVWIGSCSGPYRSRDGGRTWEWKRKGMPPPRRGAYTVVIEKVLFDPADATRLLAFGGSSRGWTRFGRQGAIWESVDAGESWRRLGTITRDGFTTNAVDGANIVKAFSGPALGDGGAWLHVFARDGAGWLTSLDGGRTWRRRKTRGVEGEITSVAVHPDDPRVVWAVTDAGTAGANGKLTPGHVYKSTDGGRSFARSDVGIRLFSHEKRQLTSRFRDIAVSPADPKILYVSDMAWSTASIWVSADGGESWRLSADKRGLDTCCFAGPSVKLSPSPTRRGTVYAYNSEYVLKSTDGGGTWRDMTACRPDPSRPDHWRGRGWNGWCSIGVVFNPYRRGELIVFGMDASRGWLTRDGGASWSYAHGTAGPWCGGRGAAFSKNGFVYVTSGQRGENCGVVISRDGGRTWVTRLGAGCGLPERRDGEYDGVWVEPERGLSAFVMHGGRMYRTEDGGESWRVDASCTETGCFAEDPTKPGRFYLKNHRGVFVTEDWRTFRHIGLEGRSEGLIACDAKGRVLVCRGRDGSNFGLFRYNPADGGWIRLFDHRFAFAVAADPGNPARLAMTTQDRPYHDFAGCDGVYVSADEGQTWTQANRGLHNLRLSCIAFDPFDPETLVAGTGGGGFVKGRWRTGPVE